MPAISTFYGILIRMFFNDHAPPHFHARYGDFEATIDDGLEGRVRLRQKELTGALAPDGMYAEVAGQCSEAQQPDP